MTKTISNLVSELKGSISNLRTQQQMLAKEKHSLAIPMLMIIENMEKLL